MAAIKIDDFALEVGDLGDFCLFRYIVLVALVLAFFPTAVHSLPRYFSLPLSLLFFLSPRTYIFDSFQRNTKK